MLAPNWEGLNSNMNDLGTQLKQYYNQEKAKKDAIQAIIDQGRARQQVQEMDPMYQMKLKEIKDYLSQQGQSTDPNGSSPEGIVGVDTGAGPSLGPRLQPTITMGKGEPVVKFGSQKLGVQTLGERKFQIQQDEKAKQQEIKSNFVKEYALDSLRTIGEVEKGIGHFGIFGQVPSIPGTERFNWENNTNKLLSGKIIDLMMAMKEASKTGATGFGQLSAKELLVLQQASTALKRGSSPEDAKKYLDIMKTALSKIAGGKGEAIGNEMPHPEFQVGQTIEKNGTTYTYKGDGQWEY